MTAEILDLDEAVWHASCRFYRGKGTCDSGCWTEPVCQTNEPVTSWPDIIAMWGPMAHETPVEEYDEDSDTPRCLKGPFYSHLDTPGCDALIVPEYLQ
jgi:hypothetical protein